MKLEMTRLEMLWLFVTMAGCLSSLSDRSPTLSIAFSLLSLSAFLALAMRRWKQVTKERQELEAKYAAQDAELLSQYEKHHG